MLKRFIHWLKLVLGLREPNERESIYQTRMIARRLYPYDSRLARELELQADKAEAALKISDIRPAAGN